MFCFLKRGIEITLKIGNDGFSLQKIAELKIYDCPYISRRHANNNDRGKRPRHGQHFCGVFHSAAPHLPM